MTGLEKASGRHEGVCDEKDSSKHRCVIFAGRLRTNARLAAASSSLGRTIRTGGTARFGRRNASHI